MHDKLLINLRGMGPEEYEYLRQILNGMDERQAQSFVMFYSGKRKSAQDILLFTLLGLLGIAGVQRFVVGQIGMGILYFITCGLCFIGTIVDLINHKSITNEYNRKVAREAVQMVRLMQPKQV